MIASPWRIADVGLTPNGGEPTQQQPLPNQSGGLGTVCMVPPAPDGETLSDGVHAVDLAAPMISLGNHRAVEGSVISSGRVYNSKSGRRNAQEMERQT